MGRQGDEGPTVSPLRMAERGDADAGSVDVRRLPAVADMLAPGEEPVDIAWRIEGGSTAEGRPMLSIALAGTLPLVCQRCLATFAWPLARQTRVLLARDDAELASLDEMVDDEVILGSAKVGAHALVGDELLLTLPFAPVHPAACP